MANIWIEGHGVFSVNNEKVQDLLSWLVNNQAVQAEGHSQDFDGQKLLNETGESNSPGPPQSNPANVGNPKPKLKPDGSGTYDFGTTWI